MARGGFAPAGEGGDRSAASAPKSRAYSSALRASALQSPANLRTRAARTWRVSGRHAALGRRRAPTRISVRVQVDGRPGPHRERFIRNVAAFAAARKHVFVLDTWKLHQRISSLQHIILYWNGSERQGAEREVRKEAGAERGE